jgi:DNA polymerase-1
VSLDDVKLTYVQTTDDLRDFLTWLSEDRNRPVIGVDTETTGLDPYGNGQAVRLIQVGDAHAGWAFDWERWAGPVLAALSEWHGEFVGHNLYFDIRWIEQHSDFRFDRGRLHDTMIMHQVINPLGPHGLKPLSTKHVDRRAAVGDVLLKEAMAKGKWDWSTVPLHVPAYTLYAALDPVLTVRLHDQFYPRVRPDSKLAGVYDLEMRVQDITARMESRGMRIDRDYALQKAEELAAYAENVKQWGKDRYKVLLSSPKQLTRLLEDMGCEITQVSKTTGAPSADKYQLEMLQQTGSQEVQDLCTAVLHMRKASKFSSSYFQAVIDAAHSTGDGWIVHPSIRVMGARTSRMSVSTPPLQQIPKGDATVRDIFVPREGNVLVSSDYDQIEMRMAASFSDDPGLIKAFEEADATGGDFFTEMGRVIYSDPDFQKSDKRRGLVKNTLYGFAYGAGPAKMAESAGVPLEQMKGVVNAVNKSFPGLRRMSERIIEEGRIREKHEGVAYVDTPLGRRLPADEDRVYTLVNYLIQGAAAEIFKQGLVALDNAGYGPHMALPVHDEILLDIPSELAGQAKAEVPEIIGNRVQFRVPLTAGADGPYARWGAKYR